MIQQRSFSLLSSAERHLLRQNRTYAGQCIRCIHTSKPVQAEDSKSKSNSNDNGTPYNTPKRGPNRQERAAKVSSEVSALAADLPQANLSGRNAEVDGAQSKSPGVSPQSQGKNVAPGRMGENDSPRREGPFAQGVGRVVRGSDEDPTDSKEARGIRTPNSKIETPSEGGASVMEPLGAAAEVPVAKQPNAGTAEAPAATTTRTTSSLPVAPAKEIAPSKSAQTIAQYLHSGNGTSTLLNNNFPGMIADRAAVLSPRSSPATPTNSEVAFRLRHQPKQLTAFRTQTDQDAFTNADTAALRAKWRQLARELAEHKEKNGPKNSPIGGEIAKKISAVRTQLIQLSPFRRLRRSARDNIIDRMVLGKYDKHGLLKPREVHKQPLLNVVARELLKNPTYLTKDSEQLLGKLRGLLPTVAAAPSAAAKKEVAKKAKA
ncbi:hypothetical protein Q7P35_012458 [Cladosporium inversicolor]